MFDVRKKPELSQVLIVVTCLKCASHGTEKENKLEIDWTKQKVHFKCFHCGYDNLIDV